MNIKLTKNEENNLDNFWDFIYIFSNEKDNLESVGDFRYYIINTIKEKYNIEEFYLFEQILNKLLYKLLFSLNVKIKDIHIISSNQIVLDQAHSYTHNLLLFDSKSNSLFLNNKIRSTILLRKILSVFKNREDYNKLIKNSNYLKELEPLPDYYYSYDYPFPNVNLFFYNQNNKEVWLKNIKRLYYSNDDKYWYTNNYLKKMKNVIK